MRWFGIKTTLIVLVALALASASFAATYSTIIERRDPHTALAIWESNGKASARLADRAMRTSLKAQQTKEITKDQIDKIEAEAARLARKSVSALPLNPTAFRVLAYDTKLSRQKKVEMLEAASALSRRDTLTQIGLIEAAALSGNTARALEHYDALLRRRSGFRDAAGRGLAQAVADPELVEPIADLLRRSPPWSSLLYYYLLREPGSWDGFISLHESLQGTDQIPEDVSASFARTLVDAGRVDSAVKVASLAKAQPLRASRGLSDKAFRIEPQFPGSWIVFDEATAALTPLKGGGAMLSLSGGSVGPIAARLVRLQPGNYVARITTENSSNESDDLNEPVELTVALSCGDPRQTSNRTATLSVNGTCRYQWLTIYSAQPAAFDSDVFLTSITVQSDD